MKPRWARLIEMGWEPLYDVDDPNAMITGPMTLRNRDLNVGHVPPGIAWKIQESASRHEDDGVGK